MLVCNYGPGGNIIDKPVYIIGEPGSECPKGTKATEKGLCELNAKWDESNQWLWPFQNTIFQQARLI